MLTITEITESKSIVVNGENTSTTSTTKTDIAANGGVFIIPNGLARLSGDYREKDRRAFYEQCRLIDDEGEHELPTATGKLVELWYEAVSDLDCDNIVDHGFNIELNGERVHLQPESSMTLMPIDIFLGKKEGDIVTIRVPLRKNFEDAATTLTLSMRLAQKDYRYRRFGTFEEVLLWIGNIPFMKGDN